MEKFNGAFLINKEKGMTSHDVVFKLRKIIKDKQIGHTGTLDPMATGVLICLVGSSVKLLPYLGNENKQYTLELKLGLITDSWDITGTILQETSIQNLTPELVLAEVNKLSGPQEFAIPLYSAKKVDGVKLYEIARKQEGEGSFIGPEKQMNFWDFKNIKINLPLVSLNLWCSKGSFIRSWAYQLGQRLGVGATLTNLERTSIDIHNIEKAQTLNEIVQDIQQGKRPRSFLSQNELVQSFYTFELNESEIERVENGLISYELQNRILQLKIEAEIVFCFYQNRLAAIMQIKPDLRLKRVFKSN